MVSCYLGCVRKYKAALQKPELGRQIRLAYQC
jgi:hypothetical protein